MLDTEQRALGLRVAKVARRRRRIRDGVPTMLIDRQCTPVRLQAGTPVADVCTEEREVDACAFGLVERTARSGRPVLVVAVDNHQPVAPERRRIVVGVEVGLVRNIQTRAGDISDKWILPAEQAAAYGRSKETTSLHGPPL